MFAFVSCLLAASPVALELSSTPDDGALVAVLWAAAPDLQLTRAKIAASRAELQRAGFLPNPALDVSANTLPIGETNPPGLSESLANIPNYAFSVSEMIELGKRGPRQEAARHALTSALYDARFQLAERLHDLQSAIGDIAAAEERISALRELAEDAARLSTVERARADKGDTASLDADRALLEEEKLQAALSQAQSALAASLRACSAIVGMPCKPFGDGAKAGAWLARPATVVAEQQLRERADLKSLEAQELSAQASVDLAHAKVIPDPTVRLGYVRDQFLVSGNQQNSLFVGVTIPIPAFDHGQAEAAAATAAADSVARARQRLIDVGTISVARFADEESSLSARRERLKGRALPLAHSVVERLDAAVKRGGADIQDLLLARKSLGELLLDSADVDLAVLKLNIERSRLSGTMPALPDELVIE